MRTSGITDTGITGRSYRYTGKKRSWIVVCRMDDVFTNLEYYSKDSDRRERRTVTHGRCSGPTEHFVEKYMK